jgi:hypothetical protein
MSQKSRLVRIFISSTFRDFMTERDELVKKVFPELRRRCRQRFVEIVEVDLRWGITVEQAESGQVLPICLSEIEKCRPFFIGLLGERYGWIPPADVYERELVNRLPWLSEHAGGKSVTELEMLHGVLNNPEMAGQALFYFRDKAWSETLGVDGFSESPADQNQLENLKERIRKSGFPVVESYENPAQVANMVLEDLWDLIDKAFPIEAVPTGDDLIDWAHADFAKSRLACHIPRLKAMESIDRALKESNVVVVVGTPGCGKSSLLADWHAREERNSENSVWYHSIGCALESADPQAIQRRLLRWLIKLCLCDSTALTDERAYTRAISSALSAAAATERKLTLVIDSLDQLSEPQLDWLPILFPKSVKVILSSQSGFFEKEFAARKWLTVSVLLLEKQEIRDISKAYLARYRKELSPSEEKMVIDAPGVSNPLFLRVLLDELRQVANHQNLAIQIAYYASDERLEELFFKIFQRLETDFSRDLVAQMFGHLWASRSGLSESELQRLLRRNNGEERLPRAILAPFLGAVHDFLTIKTGRISIFHATLSKVVSSRYAADKLISLHEGLAAFFKELAHDHPRRLSEEVFHWAESLRLGGTSCLDTIRQRVFEYGYSFEKIAAGMLEDCAADYERLAEITTGDFEPWVRFIRYRMAALRELREKNSRQELHLQMALEDGEDSAVTRAARAWMRKPTRPFAVACAQPSLNAMPDPYEALYRHPLCPAPKDLRGHASWITGWLILSSGEAVSWSRDPYLVAWSLTSERPLRKIAGFAEGTLGAMEDNSGNIWCWGFGGALKIWTPSTDNVLEKSLPATVEGARLLASGELVFWDIEGRILRFAEGTFEPSLIIQCQQEVVGVYISKDSLLVHTPQGIYVIKDECLVPLIDEKFHPENHVETADGDILVSVQEFAAFGENGGLVKKASNDAGVRDLMNYQPVVGYSHAPTNASSLSLSLSQERSKSFAIADTLLVDWPLSSVIALEASTGRMIPWLSRSRARLLWSHPPSDLHLVTTLNMLVPVKTIDAKGGSDVPEKP